MTLGVLVGAVTPHGASLAAGAAETMPIARLVPTPSRFVVAKDGHFYLDGKRLRLWGYNLQAGAYPDYEAIGNVSSRLARLGINGVRLWPTMRQFYDGRSIGKMAMMQSRKGDGSPLDKYDFMVAELKRHGIFIHNTALHYIGTDIMASWPDPEVQEIFGANAGLVRLRKLHGIAPYLSAAYERMLATHIGNYLQHVNPYTGQAYAQEEAFSAWELSNEGSFVYCMFDRACIDGLPPILQRHLRGSWRDWQMARAGGADDSLPPFDEQWGKQDGPLHREYREFVVTRFVETSRRLEKIARAQAAPGVGIAVQPISYNSHTGSPLVAAHAAAAAGDFMEAGVYQTPTTADKAAPYYPWDPLLGKGPRLHNFSYGAVAGKPLVVYETSFFMPYPYRSEWGGMMLGLAASQDWDAVYFYVYGEPWLIYRGKGANADYGQAPLPMPAGKRADYTHGFHHGGDEVAIASWTAAGLGFINGGLEPAPKSAVYRFGASHLYGLPPGYCAGAGGCGKGNKLLIFEMYDASLAGMLRVAFDGKSNDGGQCEPCVPAAASRRIQVSKNIMWDMENVRAVFDSPTYKAVIGALQGKVIFSGGLQVDFRKPVFGSFALLSADGQPVAQSSDIRMVMSGSSQNTGFVLDPEKIDFKLPYGALIGVTDPGRAPVVALRPETDIVIPGWKGKIERFDFTLRRYAQDPVDNSVQFSADEPFFYGRLTP